MEILFRVFIIKILLIRKYLLFYIKGLLSFEILLKNNLYLGGLPELLISLYQKFDLDEGFQGCFHKLLINGREIMFNNSDFIGQNIDECSTNLCRSKSCENDLHYLLIDRCLTKPCEKTQQCINIYPNNYLCICSNCSLSMNAKKYFNKKQNFFYRSSIYRWISFE